MSSIFVVHDSMENEWEKWEAQNGSSSHYGLIKVKHVEKFFGIKLEMEEQEDN